VAEILLSDINHEAMCLSVIVNIFKLPSFTCYYGADWQ